MREKERPLALRWELFRADANRGQPRRRLSSKRLSRLPWVNNRLRRRQWHTTKPASILSRERFLPAWTLVDIPSSDARYQTNNVSVLEIKPRFATDRKQFNQNRETDRRDFMRTVMAICISLAMLAAVVSAQKAQVAAKPLTDTDIQLLRS